jgi:hypothetical protein
VHPNHGFNFNFVSVVQVEFSCSFESCFFQGLKWKFKKKLIVQVEFSCSLELCFFQGLN